MSVKAILELESVKYNILTMDLSFNQSMDECGKPNAKPNGGIVSVTVEMSHDASILMKWMISHDSTKDLKIISSTSEMSKSDVIVLENAYCVGYHTHFESEGTTPMIIELTITSQKFKYDDAVMEKSWYVSSKN